MRVVLALVTALLSHAAAATPLVHMLVPGFTVEELRVKLPNINNLRFADDGGLFALGYNGKIYVLRDSNRDGLEDTVQEFWDKSTLSVPVGMALAPEGVYVSSHGKVSLLRDTDADGKADDEAVIASGWPPTDVASGGVDATAVTRDSDGNLYFGLLTADYSNPYRVKDGKSRYDLDGMRGTIQKWSKASGKLKTIATGIRVPYALAFNRHGDLFVTDQEGETWCPNGNPFDELNHIIPGKNYGFPPRHPEYLPDLVSEPPVVAFGPQHQSTCGLIFNEPRKGQGLFGPKWWEGDGFVAGESRGKIWRVRLVKTSRGYVGKEHLIARLNMLTTDVAISPRGELYVSCHSGLPDWGTGPTGEGKLFKISYTDRSAPQPKTVRVTRTNVVRIEFDRPIDGAVANKLAGSTIEFGQYVRAGDPYEVLKPPYKTVKQQDAAPRGKLKILRAEVTDDGMTLVLRTEPHPLAVTYAVKIPGVKRKHSSGHGETVELDYDLGELASVVPQPAKPAELTATPGSTSPPGDVVKGRELFFSERLKCSTCHRMGGEGPDVGPDLGNLAHRDVASILRDIKEPSASINPDYVAYTVALHNDDSLIGFIRSQSSRRIRLVGADGKETALFPTDIREMRPSSLSLMPEGLLEGLSDEQVNDLLAFLAAKDQRRLTSAATKPRNPQPPQRSRAEIENAVNSSKASKPGETKPLHVVLIASKQDHGPGEHDYPAWQTNWTKLLAQAGALKTSTAWQWPTEQQFANADALMFYYWNHSWTAERYKQVDEFLARGGGLVILHSACIADTEPEPLAERIGLSAQPKRTGYRHGALDLKIVATQEEPITAGLPRLIRFVDETYWPMIGNTNDVRVLATAEEQGQWWPMIWTFQKGKGRVFGSILGHYSWTYDDPFFRLLVLRGLAWVTGEPAARFERLAVSGVELK